MSVTVIPVPAGEAAAPGTQPAPIVAPAPRVDAIKLAAAAGRQLLADAAAKGATVATPAVLVARAGEEPIVPVAQTPEEMAAELAREAEEGRLAATETPEETEARHNAAAEALAAQGATSGSGKALVVKIPGRSAEDPDFDLEVGDQESFEALNRLTKGYARREQAEQIYEQAQQIRERAEDITYAAELDPADIITKAITQPADVDQLFRFLATRAGVLERCAEWIGKILDEPETLTSAAAEADAERITRRDNVRGEIQVKMAFDDNARVLLRTVNKSIESLAPATFTDDARALLKRDLRADMIAVVQAQIGQYREENPRGPIPVDVRMLDPRRVPGLIQRRFALMGVALRAATDPAKTGTLPAGGTPPVGRAPLTAAALTAARTARAAAASAPPGAGSPVATITKPPAYDPKQTGTPLQQAARWARDRVAALTKKPT